MNSRLLSRDSAHQSKRLLSFVDPLREIVVGERAAAHYLSPESEHCRRDEPPSCRPHFDEKFLIDDESTFPSHLRTVRVAKSLVIGNGQRMASPAFPFLNRKLQEFWVTGTQYLGYQEHNTWVTGTQY
jgi:hypothetical protein